MFHKEKYGKDCGDTSADRFKFLCQFFSRSSQLDYVSLVFEKGSYTLSVKIEDRTKFEGNEPPTSFGNYDLWLNTENGETLYPCSHGLAWKGYSTGSIFPMKPGTVWRDFSLAGDLTVPQKKEEVFIP